ncbi:MAG: ABC transporter substrate-binding protein [Gammaproteobacteria bacterium]|nr:ABC transporter substrate-binding protein [Gammaproteobacteria bacterium]MYF03427.1 ABC transporter substrate-binding protein [Gammaproteobacteria bacterium]
MRKIFHRLVAVGVVVGFGAFVLAQELESQESETEVEDQATPSTESSVDASSSPGIYPDRVKFGQSCALTGRNAASGVGMRLGLQAAFQQANENGGIHGRMIELITLDDGYEPVLTIENSRKLILEEQVFALIGAVGTPTSRVAVPFCQEHNVPYIGPLTGAAFLREEQDVVINLRASYAQETEEMVKFLTQEVGTDKIAIFYQDDSYGRAGYNGTLAAMEKRGLEFVSSGNYRRNTLDVRTAVLDISEADPDAIIMIGSYEPSAEFIKWSKKVGMDAIFVNISFVNINALAEELGSSSEGVLVTQVVPFPMSKSLDITKNYQAALKALDPDLSPEFFSYEGYLVGRLALLGLERAGADVTRESFLEEIRSLENVDLEGYLLDFGDDNQGSDSVFITVLAADGSCRDVESIQDMSLP